MTALLKKDSAFTFGQSQQDAFAYLKKAFTTAPVLEHFQPGEQVFLETDASDFAIAAVISQKDSKSKIHPITFFSRKLQPAELIYDIHDKELLAIIEEFKHWRQYLEGTVQPTLVYTDHQNLQYFTTSKVLNRRQARWAELFASYHFNLVHRAGTLQGKTDSMSRRSDYAVGSKASDSQPQTLLSPALFAANLTLRLQVAALGPFPELQKRIYSAQEHEESISQVLQDLTLKENLDRYTDLPWTLDDSGLLLWDAKIYIPEDPDLQLELLRLCHDTPTAGHPGIDKTLSIQVAYSIGQL